MKSLLWKALAKVVSTPAVAEYLIRRSQRTPYFHLEGYMNRWWLFNAYGFDLNQSENTRHEKPIKFLPSIRIHHILRADEARDLHDHPWDARTIILNGWYRETRLVDGPPGGEEVEYLRKRGDTAALNYGEYHTISEVSPGGVWTLFMTWDYIGTWGFLVNGKKVPWRQYEGKQYD